MATWAPGDVITATKLNLGSVFAEDTTVATTSIATGSYDNSTRLLSVSLTAPASGRIEAILAVRCDNSSGVNTLSDLLISGTVSGTLFSPSTTTAVQWNGAASAGPFSTARQITCVAGETITITAQHRVASASTGNFRYRQITAKSLVS